jgi:SNF2 family DNA or RNA helicase
MLKKSNLYDHQIKAIDFIVQNKKCGLFLDMAAGKTASSLTAASIFIDSLFVDNVLIVAPLRVANSVWKQEASKWEYLKNLKISIATGDSRQRGEALNSKCDITIINRENIPWLIKNHKWKWDMLIIDESTSFKNYKSLRFKEIAKVLKFLKSTVILTGTPSPNGMMDLWSQIYLLDQGERLGRNITKFRNRYFTQDNYVKFKYNLIKGADKEILEKIKDVCLSIEIPGKIQPIYLNRYVELPDKIMKSYKELEKEYILSILNIKTVIAFYLLVAFKCCNLPMYKILHAMNKDILALSGGALYNKLRQVCNGAVYDEGNSYHEIHSEKIKELKNIIEDNPCENFLIAYNYKHDLERLLKAFPKQAIHLDKDPKTIDNWNKGKIKILIAHPASAGHGLNLQFGGSTIIWFGLDANLEYYLQFNARLTRTGQKKTVKIIHLIIENCIDEDILNTSLKEKDISQNKVISYFKNKLLNV